MTSHRIRVKRALLNEGSHDSVSVTLENGIITEIEPLVAGSVHENTLLLPAFVDIQVNGGGDVQFNQQPSVQGLEKIAAAHAQGGTGLWLPTTTSSDMTVMQAAADAVAQAIHRVELGILGIHFEGPHLAPEKRGVHPQSALTTLTQEHFELYTRKDLGQVVVTLAPEAVTPEQIGELVKNKVVILLGHSNASFEQTRAAIDAGARGFTHLFNAMSGLQSRQPGVVGAALSSDYPYGIILDGHHVHPAAAQVAYRANPNLILVTDAMAVAAGKKDYFVFEGQKIFKKDNRLLDHQGRLAGSTLTMFEAVKNARQMLNLSWQEVVAASHDRALHLLGLNALSLMNQSARKPANLVLLDTQQEKILALWRHGVKVYSAS